MLSIPLAKELLNKLEELDPNAQVRISVAVEPDDVLDLRQKLFDFGYLFTFQQSPWADHELTIADYFPRKV